MEDNFNSGFYRSKINNKINKINLQVAYLKDHLKIRITTAKSNLEYTTSQVI